MPETWVISDPHFGHQLVANERGFATAAEHDSWLMAECLKRFRKLDDIWWLGDIAFAGWRERLPNTIGLLPGRHRLVLGNHDRPHPLNSNGFNYLRDFLTVFDSVGMAARLSWQGQGAMLSHFPYVNGGDHTDEDRYTAWRLVDTGKLLIHGHTHSTVKVSHSALGTLQLNAAVDAWRGPVTLAELMELAKEN